MTTLKWLPYPLLRFSLIFILGIVAGFEMDFDFVALEFLMVTVFGIYLWLALKTTGPRFRNCRLILAALGLTVVAVAGILRTQWHPNVRDSLVSDAEYYHARVVEPPGLTNPRSTLQIQKVWYAGSSYAANDHVIFYPGSNEQSRLGNRSIHSDSSTPFSNDRNIDDGASGKSRSDQQLRFGDQIIVKGRPYAIRKPANPKEFDYAAYMSRKNVFWQHSIKQGDILRIIPGKEHGLYQLANKIKRHLQRVITQSLPVGAPQEITRAMLLGDRAAVSEDLENSFIRSGAIHILAVSGLHLGILYWLLSQIFAPWRRHSLLKWVFITVGLVVLWCFTLITGMAPSTLRAASMFSVMLLANTLSRQSNSTNTLGAAAIFILYADPYQIYSVGFQLSFLALGGILYLQPLLKSFLHSRNIFLRYVWELLSVSLAAQIGVFPISIYYFNQIPLYFLLANIILVPAAFGIVVLGIVFFISTLIPSMVLLTSEPLAWLTKMAAMAVTAIGKLPGSTIYHVEVGISEVLVYYVFLFSGVLFFKYRLKAYWMVLISLMVIFTIMRVHDHMVSSKRRMLTVYHVPGHTAIDFIEGNNFKSIMDAQLSEDTAVIEYKIKNNRRYLVLEPPLEQIILFDSEPNFNAWVFNGKKVLLINSLPPMDPNGNIKLKYDIVIVTNNSVREFRSINSRIRADLWLIDGSNKPWIANQLEKEGIKVGLNVHNSWSKGAKIINLRKWH